jgi:hypothetical protein
MRYHKAIPISAVEAKSISSTSTISLNRNSVISLDDKWYDVRSLTERELEAFVVDLLRAERSELLAGRDAPH